MKPKSRILVVDDDPGGRRLTRATLTRAGFDNAERRRWTRHGSTKHLFRPEEIQDKINYTLNQQGERMAYYDAQEPRTK